MDYRRRTRKLTLSFLSFLAVALFAGVAFATGDAEAAGGEGWTKAMIGLACGMGMGLAAFGGALGQSRAAAAALEGIGRNPNAAGKIFTPMILALALIESLVIYSLVISFMLLGKL